MSGFEKHLVVQQLKAQGWTEDTEAGRYMLRPPRELLDRLASMTFHAYDARDLQAFVAQADDDAQDSSQKSPTKPTIKSSIKP